MAAQLVYHQTENESLEFLDGHEQQWNLYDVGWALYKIKSGDHANETILAYKGTTNWQDFVQDFSVAFGGPTIRTVIGNCVALADAKKPNWLTGHSLGGCLAESVCSETSIGGASFNAPGPYTLTPGKNLVAGGRYHNVPFEVHLTRNDPVSMCGNISGPDGSHVGIPKWHTARTDDVSMTDMVEHVHGMTAMREHL